MEAKEKRRKSTEESSDTQVKEDQEKEATAAVRPSLIEVQWKFESASLHSHTD